MTFYVGIDLGTTNSAICSYDGEALRLHKSPEQNDVTPSAIFFDRRHTKFVGQRAYDNAAHSPQNAVLRFKRLMGSSTPISVPAVNLTLTPEQCSAEVLKTLFGYLPEEIRAGVPGTVITVPAAFDQTQKEATLEAGRLAGIGAIALMQEPVAAVMSIMRARRGDGRFLIFDLGGGTLDIALAESVAGRVSLLSHGGIAVCGGRDFDRLLVDRVIRPWILEHFSLADDAFRAGQPLERLASWAAERAKIELSSRESTTISLSEAELRQRDSTGTELYLDVPLSRDDLNAAIRDKLSASVACAEETLAKAGLKAADVDRMVFVGGPTQYKPLRDRVSSDLGIAAALDVNPMTAVAEGAAVFAEAIDWSKENRSRKNPRDETKIRSDVAVSLTYTSRTPESRARVLVKTEGTLPPGSEFQIDSLDSGWSSGRCELRQGAGLDVPLSKNGPNTFKVFVFAPTGMAPTLTDNRIVITRTAATIDAIPASHSVGVEVLEKVGGRPVLEYLVREGEALPKKSKVLLKAAENLRAGSSGSLNLKLWEGEITHPVSDNRFIGLIKIKGSDFDRGVIESGASLECEYEVLDSGNIDIHVSVPSIGATFDGGRNFYSPQDGQIDLSNAGRQIADEGRSVLDRVEQVAGRVMDPRLESARALGERASECRPEDADPEAYKDAMDGLLEAKRIMANVRKDHLKEVRQAELDRFMKFVEDVLRPHARPAEINNIESLTVSARRVLSRDDGDFENYLEEMRAIAHGILWRQDWFVLDRFRRLTEASHLFTSTAQFNELVAAGEAALRSEDIDRLRTVVIEMLRSQIGWGVEDEMTIATNVLKG